MGVAGVGEKTQYMAAAGRNGFFISVLRISFGMRIESGWLKGVLN
jgi:hypothetical protein